jgi:CheY-like chemotaxis protein
MLTGTPPIYETKDKIQRLSRSRFVDVVPITRADPTLPKSISQIVARAMELNVEERYQTPGEMLAEVKAALRKQGEAEGEVGTEGGRATAAAAPEPPRRSLMFVESNVQLQDVLRERLKTNGYRVLVTADPERALSRFTETNRAADCVIFSTGELGDAALKAFNQFGEMPHTAEIPALLLLGEHHAAWQKDARLADHRVAISMPIKLRQFREVLAKLVPLTEGTKSA